MLHRKLRRVHRLVLLGLRPEDGHRKKVASGGRDQGLATAGFGLVVVGGRAHHPMLRQHGAMVCVAPTPGR